MDYSNQLLINDLGYHVVSGSNLLVQTLAPTATPSKQIRARVNWHWHCEFELISV